MRPFAGLLLCVVLPTATAAQWTSSVHTDEMTGAKLAFTLSPSAAPSRTMDFPYGDTEAWLGFACNGKEEWAYFEFSNTPNLVNTQPRDGYSFFTTRLKWDDVIQNVRLAQKWGATSINFTDDAAAIANLSAAGSEALLELDWYGNGKVYFRFSLKGATDAIAQTRAACKQ